VATERSDAPPLVQTSGEWACPLLIGPQAKVRGPGSLDRGPPRLAPVVCGLGKTHSEPVIPGIDRALSTRLRIFDHQESDVGQSEFATVDDFDRDDLAAAAEPRQRRPPHLSRGDEIRDDDREPTPTEDPSECIDGATEVDLSAER